MGKAEGLKKQIAELRESMDRLEKLACEKKLHEQRGTGKIDKKEFLDDFKSSLRPALVGVDEGAGRISITIPSSMEVGGVPYTFGEARGHAPEDDIVLIYEAQR